MDAGLQNDLKAIVNWIDSYWNSNKNNRAKNVIHSNVTIFAVSLQIATFSVSFIFRSAHVIRQPHAEP